MGNVWELVAYMRLLVCMCDTKSVYYRLTKFAENVWAYNRELKV